MDPEYHRLLLIFVDGVGLAPAAPGNPLAGAPTPALRSLLGGPLTLEQAGAVERRVLRPIDACLGVEGRPQSATGQTALFTGVNAARRLGRHVTGFVGPRLRSILDSGNLFLWAKRRGRRVTFANAYRPLRPEALRRPVSVTTCALAAAGLPRRTLDDLRRGEAVAWDVVRDRFSEGVDGRVPGVTACEAGRHLGALAAIHDLTVYETFVTDLAGHRRFGFTAEEAMRRVDGLLAGVLAAAPPGLTVVLTSDHGNLEDGGSRIHTFAPVPLLAVGPQAARFADLDSILEVTPRILELLPPVAPS